MGRLIRLDWAIKKILRDKANFDILEGFLSELLRFEIRIREILESESNREHETDRSNRVDLLVEDTGGRLLIVEVQNETEYDYLQRLLYGTSKVLVEHIQKGVPYAQIKKIYSVSIVYFDLGKGEDYLYHGTTKFRGLRFDDDLELTDVQRKVFEVQNPADLFPEYYLIKVPKYDDQIRDTLDEWIYFLKNEEVRDDFSARGLQSAREKLSVMKMTEQDRKRYEAYLEDLHYQASIALSTYGFGHLTGKMEGYADGRDDTRRETARRLLSDGMDPEKVARMTDLSPDEVRGLDS